MCRSRSSSSASRDPAPRWWNRRCRRIPKIAAGDELPLIHEITAIMPRMLASPLGYPEALAELWMGDQREGLDNLRDYYLQKVRQMGVLRRGAARFTDKMPLNETHLGLIALLFPEAPLIHVLRHPLGHHGVGVFQRVHPWVLLRVRSAYRGEALRARDGPGAALPRRDDAALSADPLRGHRRATSSKASVPCWISSARNSTRPV